MIHVGVCVSDGPGGDLRGHRLNHGQFKQHRHGQGLQTGQQGTIFFHFLTSTLGDQVVISSSLPTDLATR